MSCFPRTPPPIPSSKGADASDRCCRSRDDSELPLISCQPSSLATTAPRAVDDITIGVHRPRDGTPPWPPLVEPQPFPRNDEQAVTPVTGAHRVRPAIQRLVQRLQPRETAAQVILLGVGDISFNPLARIFGNQPQPHLGMRSPQSFETVLDLPRGVRANLVLVDIGPTILAAALQDARIATRLRPDDAVQVTGIARDLRCLPWAPRSVDAAIATWTILYPMKNFEKQSRAPVAAQKKGQLAQHIINALKPGAPGLLVDFGSVCHMVRGLHALRHRWTTLSHKRAAQLLKQGQGPEDFSTGLDAARDVLNEAAVGLFDIEIAQGPDRPATAVKSFPSLYRIWRKA